MKNTSFNPAVFFLVLMLIGSLYSCSKKECSNPGLKLDFHFDSSAAAIIKITKYKQGSNFSQISAAIVTGTSIRSNNASGDTLIISDEVVYIGGYDYVIELPNINRVFKIRDISYKQEVEHYSWGNTGDAENVCSNTVSWYLNDTACHGRGTANTTSLPGAVWCILQ